MMTFLSVGAAFISGVWVFYTGYTTMMAGAWVKGLAFLCAGVFTVVAAKRMYDSRTIKASIAGLDKAIAEAEYEMFGAEV